MSDGRYDCYSNLGYGGEGDEALIQRDEYIRELQRQLAEVTKERDQLRAMLNLADALRNRERNSKC